MTSSASPPPTSLPSSALPPASTSSSVPVHIVNHTTNIINRSIPHEHRQQHPSKRRQSGLFLIALVGILSAATLLAVHFVPRDEHSPRILMHPLSSIKHSEPQPQDSIRYLTFGSSSTWGEGLEEPQQQAYPWLLSPSVHNVAARVGGISLSAICTQSIVGDSVYDVIVIEFMDSDAEGVVQLANRIRQRFPSATLVFVRLWSPATHVVYDGAVPLLEWWKQQSKEPAIAEEDQRASVLSSYQFQNALLSSDAQKWSLVDNSQRVTVVDAAIAQVNGYLYELPLPTSGDSIPLLLTSPTYTTLFQDSQPQFLSSLGHLTVARGIEQLLQQHPVAPQRDVGTWGSGDACSMWYGTGDYSALRSRRRAVLVDFSKSNDGFHKHAVEISRRGGSIDVTNPFPEPRMLYLTYMTAASSKGAAREYPRTKVSVRKKASVLIDPIHDEKDSGNHLTRTTAVGLVPPGRTAVKFSSLDADSTSRFRLVGHHFLAKGKVPIPFEFDLEPDQARR